MVDRIKNDDEAEVERDEAGAQPDPLEAKKKQFEAEQEARERDFERTTKGAINKMERDANFAAAKAERDKKIADRRQELQDLAFEHGVITHDELMRRKGLNAPHAQQGVLQPHEVLANNEPTVLMAFPRTVILALSVDDVKRWHDHEPTIEGIPPVTQGSRVVFYQGYEDVPEGLADHHYLQDAGAYRVDDNGKPESVEERDARLSKTSADAEESKRPDSGDDKRDT